MMTLRLGTLSGSAALLLLAVVSSACNSVIGLNDLEVDDSPATPGGECETNAECIDKLSAASGAETPAVCVQPEGKCVPLFTEDCDAVTGDPRQDGVIVLGSLFSTKGAQADTNIRRQQSAMLAVTEINSLGGIPTPSGNRSVVMVSCNETAGAWKRSADHLVNELKVPAIVGPNTSQDTIDVSTQISVPGGTVMMTPSAVASEIGDLVDNDLTWLMVPSDVQRAPLMIRQVNDIERQIKQQRGVDTVKLSVITRGDALGIGTRTSLNSLRLNDRPLSEQIGAEKSALFDSYEPTISEPNQALITKHVNFAPDIVVLAGTAEAITYVMKPLEESWNSSNPRPQYVTIDSTKVPELLTLVTNNDDLRRRVRGTGIVPDPESAGVYETFKQAYLAAYPGPATISGMGPAYDAAYSIAYAIAAAGNDPITGETISKNLRKLAGGPVTVEVGRQNLTLAFQQLSSGERIRGIGTFGALDWNENGTVVGGTLEMWCIAAPSGGPTYRSSGLNFDLATSTESGTYVQCAP